MSADSIRFSIHQPNYIPWIGYFHKIYRSDVFVILDTVQFPRGQSIGNRNNVLGPNGIFYLSVPLNKKIGIEGKFLYKEVVYSDNNWKNNHLKSIELSYKKAPFFLEFFPVFQNCILKEQSFCDMNIAFINLVCGYLNIKTRIICLSDILSRFGQKTDLIIDVGKSVNGKVYICGSGGGVEYTDVAQLKQVGIEIAYLKFDVKPYPQLWTNEFASKLSVLDVLFNCGKQSMQFIK